MGTPGGADPQRKYMYWEDANIIEWKAKKEYDGRKAWFEKWGKDWMKEYEKWIATDIRRPMRKPSLRSMEWIAWQRKFENPLIGEYNTRREVLMEPPKQTPCCPCPWPPTTYGEIGYLAQHPKCNLEIYGNKFMQKPPLPWYMRKISSLPAATAKF